MRVAFFGHRTFVSRSEYKKYILETLKEVVGDKKVEFYLGGYGNFDYFAYEFRKTYKVANPDSRLVFVTPYITDSYQKTD